MSKPPYPPAPRADVVDDYHGTEVADPYRWLEDADAEQTRSWVGAQNALTESWLSTIPAREAIRARLTDLWDHPRASPPSRRADRWFQLRNTGLQDQDVLYVMDAPDADGRALVDPNVLSSDGTVALSAAVASRDARLLAYATSAAGSDWLTWRVRDIDGGEDLPDELSWSKFSTAAWLPDGAGFYYARYDPPEPARAHEQANRDQRLWLHRVGSDQGDDVLVYARPDHPDWGFLPQVSEDGRWLVLHVWQGTRRENGVFVADLDGDGGVVELLSDFDAAYHFVGNDGPVLYLLTDCDADRGRLVAVDTRAPQRERWVELVAEADDTLEQVVLVGGRFVAVYLHHAHHRLARFHLDGRPDGEVALPGIGSVEAVTGRPSDDEAYFSFAGFTRPSAIYRHVVASGDTTLLRAPGLDVDEERYVTEQHVATSADGTRVPLFCVRRADVTPDGQTPTLLWGYGGFGIPVTPAFRLWWFLWVEAGGQLAVANLRGGGEYGEAWHDAGRLARKQNTFDDFVACAEFLVDGGLTSPERLGIAGGSNGGLLVGACLTQRPELFGACLAEVGVFDMLRFHRFTIGWAWTSDYGSPDDPEQFAWLAAYSPLHNLRPGVAYPPTLLVTGDHDDRVVPAHSLKFAAALQAAQGGDAPILLRVQTEAGHGAGKPTRVLIAERADVLAFLSATLGLAWGA